MSRPDVTDKDPFANTADVPRDNVSAMGFLTRAIIRFGLYRIIWTVVGGLVLRYIIYPFFLEDMIS